MALTRNMFFVSTYKVVVILTLLHNHPYILYKNCPCIALHNYVAGRTKLIRRNSTPRITDKLYKEVGYIPTIPSQQAIEYHLFHIIIPT